MTVAPRKLYHPTEIGLAALDELDAVPWDELAHAYGTGITGDELHQDVAASLFELTDDPAEAHQALYSNICHQGTVYEATAWAVPFLAAVAAGDIDGRNPVRARHLARDDRRRIESHDQGRLVRGSIRPKCRREHPRGTGGIE
jgi:hypothetical protein